MITKKESENKNISLIGKQYALSNTAPLSPDDYRDLVKRRAISILHIASSEDTWDNKEELRRKTEELILEKVNKESNLVPIEFLSKGVERAKAVCRIVTPSGFGTGILIDKGVIMTNNHVIPNADVAKQSFAEFCYEDNQIQIQVKLKPSNLFLTSSLKELDFTIVECSIEGIENIVPLTLLRSPTTITRGEYANIIQHPRGRKKEVALQDNTVTYVFDKAIQYTTDSEPGSSGSPVFNNQWQLVAMHHAGWYSENKDIDAVNEGIRITAIVSRLVALAQAGDSGALRLTQNLKNTSPYLGFFDVAGLIDNPNNIYEIEVPTYKGDKRFADIGYWNIENFNSSVGKKRLERVADVIYNMSMDALGLVEVEVEEMKHLVEALKDFGATMDYVCLNADGAQDLAILYDTSTTKVELKNDINRKYSDRLHAAVDGKAIFPNEREPLFAICTVKEEGKDVQFLMIVVHLKAMQDTISKKRRKAAAEVLSFIINELKQDDNYKDLPVLLGGDFNDYADSDSLAPIVNSSNLITLTTDDALAGNISYLEAPYLSLIDQIIISKEMKVGSIQNGNKVDDAAIVRFDKTIKDFVKNISDHAPLVLRLIYKDEL